jgi:hypothetical protein
MKLQGDMLVVETPAPKLMRALAVIAEHLHPRFEAAGRFVPGISKRSCVLCALTVRDFLREIGFRDAQVVSVCALVFAERDGAPVHSVGVGHPANRVVTPTNWNGHLVTTTCRYLIDATLYQAIRPQFLDLLPGMVAIPLRDCRAKSRAAGAALAPVDDPGFQLCITWEERPDNTAWRGGPDARDRPRRAPIVRDLVKEFQNGARRI